jgi:hypothetical protein
VTDEVIMEYIRTQETTKDDGDFRLDDASAGDIRSGFQPTAEPTGFQPAFIDI